MFEVLFKLKWFFKENRKRYAIAIALLLVANVIEVTPPWIIGQSIDAIHSETLTSHSLMFYIAAMLVILVLSYVVNFIWQYQLFGGANVIERKLRSKLMTKFLKMSPPFYERNRTGDLMARATNDLRAVSETAGFGIMTLIDSTLYLLTILLTMGFLVSWKLTIAAILPLPILAVVMQILGKRIHERYMKAQDVFGEMNDSVLEAVEGVRVVRAYVQERATEQQFSEMTEDVYKKNMHVEKIDALFNPITKILTGLSYMIGLGFGAYLVSKQEMTLGELVTFNVYLGMIVWPMFAIGELINVMQRGNASLDRVQETLDEKEDVVDPKTPTIIQNPESIVFKDVTFQYPQSSSINLANLEVSLKKGQTLGIVGKTGSGKTTVVKQLLREYPNGEGDLFVSNSPIHDQTKEQVRNWIGYVPQDHVLFSRTVKENILFGKSDATEDELHEAIRLANFERDLEMLPLGLQTLVGEKGVSLSGGQKQRISIARALIRDPEILILDDSLSAVDAKTEATIIQNIQTARSDKTTIIVTHRLSAIQHADWVIVLEDGRIVEEGTHQTLLEEEGWYKEQHDRQQVEGVK
ncbi:ABC transporter ATP-binding protein [Viridibacillus sp. FSL R5-0477]|uniref:ABC transporter-like protein n=1 Tax=Viridibacillus arenosi FSL R5-213 TaxID=1227360 RepID=W4ENG6_9BACL|nr:MULTISPECIES: ABC transporter ATP-binding protein [Viridibacillus]ETT82100.1 ABC transporter-like protein [Viridibacillus arenosi FSL R5-213]OMC81329.1 multidrug ABC transporter permease/ATP-binding protein [Viridibacillus sp. FSL H8-0123]OMC86753.1 multidrug ABC transporter permease/ATP-binding protein [Viridibacillus sp. FSL H7-0596]OMC90373.1 multidrug ABC transporter permease/ATP-binding protein [Viridibacillus arenosi]